MIVHWSQKFLLCKHDIDIETALVLQKTIPHLNSYFCMEEFNENLSDCSQYWNLALWFNIVILNKE